MSGLIRHCALESLFDVRWHWHPDPKRFPEVSEMWTHQHSEQDPALPGVTANGKAIWLTTQGYWCDGALYDTINSIPGYAEEEAV